MSSSIPKGPTWAVQSRLTGNFLGPVGTWRPKLENNAIAFYSREEALEQALALANGGLPTMVVRTRYVPGAKRWEEDTDIKIFYSGTPRLTRGILDPVVALKEIDPAPGRWEIVG